MNEKLLLGRHPPTQFPLCHRYTSKDMRQSLASVFASPTNTQGFEMNSTLSTPRFQNRMRNYICEKDVTVEAVCINIKSSWYCIWKRLYMSYSAIWQKVYSILILIKIFYSFQKKINLMILSEELRERIAMENLEPWFGLTLVNQLFFFQWYNVKEIQ